MATLHADDDLEAIIARTALKYDLLPYQSKPFAHSQPLRIAASARLFGLEVAPLGTARVLELGCASGGNIIPLAARYPDATFVGVDLARTQVAAGRARIKKLGLKNIEIKCQSFTEIGEELGYFDYIVCHGVYSWVPLLVQDEIFRIISARLSPIGVACVSYNVLPGWRMLQPMRDAFLLEIPDDLDSRARVAKARELANFLKETTTDKGPYGTILRNWPDQFANMPEDYIGHEFLEEMNHPTTVRAFAAGASRHGLGFLGDCDISTMFPDNYGAAVGKAVRERGGNNQVATEQYLDLLTGRTFRNTVLVSNARMPQVNRSLTPQTLEQVHFITQAGTSVKKDGDNYVMTDSAGRTLTTSSPATGAALERLVAKFPSTASVEDCLGDITDETQRNQVRDALLHMVVSGIAAVVSEPILASEVTKKPKAFEFARVDAAEGALATTNLRHETVALDVATQYLLARMDGETTHAELARHLVEAVRTGRFKLLRDGQAPEDPKEIEQLAKDHLPAMLNGIARAALLAG